MRGYYRVPKKNPANRVDGALADLVRNKFADGWPKARIAREFHINRRTVARICSETPAAQLESSTRTESLRLFRPAKVKKRRYFLFEPGQALTQNHDDQN
jgi:DNA invertase Pin-like site-specific DNA recombinase